MKKIRKIILWVVGVMAFLLLAVGIGGGIYMVGYALDPSNVKSDEAAIARITKNSPWVMPWFYEIHENGKLQKLTMESDGVTLTAFYIAAEKPTTRTVVLVHGYTDNYIVISPLAYMYHNLGYNVFIPEQYAHGRSEGNHIRMGWLDRLTYLKWIEKAHELFAGKCDGDCANCKNGEAQIVVHGVSMGAATTMMLSGEDTPSYVKAFVEDCGYTSVWDEFAGELKNQFGLPTFPILDGASLVCRIKYGWGFKEASALKQVAKCSKPMLFIHGDSDTFVPTWMVYPLYEAKPEPKELLITEGVPHAHSYETYPELYTQTVKEFLDKYLD